MPTQDDVAAFKDFAPSEAEQTPQAAAPGATEPLKPAVGQTTSPNIAQLEQQKTAPIHQQQQGGDQRLKASPYAKKLALEQGLDLSVIFVVNLK